MNYSILTVLRSEIDKDLKIISVNYIHDIYEEHGLESRLYSSNSNDPVHINDVEPLLKYNGEASDILFINLRSTSSQIIYDIKNKKIKTGHLILISC